MHLVILSANLLDDKVDSVFKFSDSISGGWELLDLWVGFDKVIAASLDVVGVWEWEQWL